MQKKALILVDIQNDFVPGGALAGSEGDAVVPVAAQAVLAAEISRVGGQVEVFTFPGGHTIPIEAIERAAKFLAAL